MTHTHDSTPPAPRLLARLNAVRETSPGRWLACCPAHDDRRPSLSIRELDDGTLLLRCWSGCETGDVVAAAGLTFADLFPAQPDDRRPISPGQRWVPRDALLGVAHEALVVAIAADAITRGDRLADSDADRVAQAAGRIHGAVAQVSR